MVQFFQHFKWLHPNKKGLTLKVSQRINAFSTSKEFPILRQIFYLTDSLKYQQIHFQKINLFNRQIYQNAHYFAWATSFSTKAFLINLWLSILQFYHDFLDCSQRLVLASVDGLDRFQEETKTLTYAYFPSRSNEEINVKPSMAASTLLPATFFLRCY